MVGEKGRVGRGEQLWGGGECHHRYSVGGGDCYGKGVSARRRPSEGRHNGGGSPFPCDTLLTRPCRSIDRSVSDEVNLDVRLAHDT